MIHTNHSSQKGQYSNLQLLSAGLQIEMLDLRCLTCSTHHPAKAMGEVMPLVLIFNLTYIHYIYRKQANQCPRLLLRNQILQATDTITSNHLIQL